MKIVKHLLAAASLAAVAAPHAAYANETSSAAAEGLFLEGRALAESGRYEAACDRFARSQELEPAVGTLLNLGECYEHLSRPSSAWLAYQQAVALAETRQDTARGALARAAAARLEPRRSHLSLAAPSDAPRGLTVTHNGAVLAPAVLGSAVPVDPGRHAVEASAPGHLPWRTVVILREGERRKVVVGPLAESAADGSKASDAQPRGEGQRTIALALEIGGGAALAGGLVFGALAASRWSSVTEGCPEGACPDEAARARHASDATAARTFATVSTVAALTGAAALATGIVLHLTAPKHRVSVGATASGATLGVRAALEL